MIGDADFSPCRRYRYTLRRRWLLGSGSILWVLLNPSKAGVLVSDPTVTRLIDFSQIFGYRQMTLLNIFALRSTDPKELRKVDDPIGPENDAWIERVVMSEDHQRVVVAWGSHGRLYGRGNDVFRCLQLHANVYGFRLTKNGNPQHPLYVARSTPLELLATRVETLAETKSLW